MLHYRQFFLFSMFIVLSSFVRASVNKSVPYKSSSQAKVFTQTTLLSYCHVTTSSSKPVDSNKVWKIVCNKISIQAIKSQNQYDQEIRALKKQVKHLEEKNKDLERALSDEGSRKGLYVSNLENQNNELLDENVALTDQISDLKDSCTALQLENNELKQTNEQLASKIADIKDVFAYLKDEIEKS